MFYMFYMFQSQFFLEARSFDPFANIYSSRISVVFERRDQGARAPGGGGPSRSRFPVKRSTVE